MPAYDRPIEYIRDPKAPKHKRVAAVITFVAGPEEMERIQAFLNRLAQRGIIETSLATEYDPEYTNPTLYFP